MAGAVLFLSSGLHTDIIALMVESYSVFPINSLGNAEAVPWMVETIVHNMGAGFALAVSLSMPFILFNLGFYLFLGIMNRAMPQLMVTFVGLPAVNLTGIMLFALLCISILTVWLDAVRKGFGGLLP